MLLDWDCDTVQHLRAVCCDMRGLSNCLFACLTDCSQLHHTTHTSHTCAHTELYNTRTHTHTCTRVRTRHAYIQHTFCSIYTVTHSQAYIKQSHFRFSSLIFSSTLPSPTSPLSYCIFTFVAVFNLISFIDAIKVFFLSNYRGEKRRKSRY